MIKKGSSYLFSARQSTQTVTQIFSAKTISRNRNPLMVLSGTFVAANMGIAYQQEMFKSMYMLYSTNNGGSGSNGGNNNGPSSSGGNNGSGSSVAHED